MNPTSCECKEKTLADTALNVYHRIIDPKKERKSPDIPKCSRREFEKEMGGVEDARLIFFS
jgi:hypothetical protein